MSEKLATLPPPQRLSALSVMAARFSVEPAKLLDTLKNTVFKNATDAQLMALCIVANELGLNPFLKEVYAFPSKDGGIIPVVSVDGWLNRINGHPQYDGMEKEFITGTDGKPVACTVTIYRKDRGRPTKHTELYSECFRKTDPWTNQPHRMLGHRAVIQCARIAFGFSGGDADDWTEPRQVSARVVEPFPLGNDSPSAGVLASREVAGVVEAPPASGTSGAETTSAGTSVAISDAHAEGVGGERAPAPASSPKGATPARRTPKPAGPSLELSGEPETSYQKLTRKIAEDRLVHAKVEKWLSHEDFPPLSMLSASDAEQVLELFGAMAEECKS